MGALASDCCMSKINTGAKSNLANSSLNMFELVNSDQTSMQISEQLSKWKAPNTNGQIKQKIQFNVLKNSYIVTSIENIPWASSMHCFQCALNTVHKCDDFGKGIKMHPNILRKFVTININDKLHYPQTRYLVSYPIDTPPLPHHNHPQGEEYLLLKGFFSDTMFGHVEAPAFVRYPIGSEHAAMTEATPVRSEQFCWWGFVQQNSDNEKPSLYTLDKNNMTPLNKPTVSYTNGNRVWQISPDGIETRFESWIPGYCGVIECNDSASIEILVLYGHVKNKKDNKIFKPSTWIQFKKRKTQIQLVSDSMTGATLIIKEINRN